MNIPRKLFLSAIILVVLGTTAGMAVFSIMEQQARAALPAREQTLQSIQTLHDGAVCLECDFGAIFLGMFGAVALIAVVFAWAAYEAGRMLLSRNSSPE